MGDGGGSAGGGGGGGGGGRVRDSWCWLKVDSNLKVKSMEHTKIALTDTNTVSNACNTSGKVTAGTLCPATEWAQLVAVTLYQSWVLSGKVIPISHGKIPNKGNKNEHRTSTIWALSTIYKTTTQNGKMAQLMMLIHLIQDEIKFGSLSHISTSLSLSIYILCMSVKVQGF